MASSVATPPVAQGAQRPRILAVPAYGSSAGEEAVELAAMAGLQLDPWEAFVLSHALGERPDGKWSAFEVGVVVSRQNGKGAILEARELAGLFLLGERLITHSAHQFDTSLEAFRRLLALIEDTPDLDRRVARVSRSHGDEGIELKGGQRIRFRTRTKGGGRGFSGDCLILDEAMDLPESAMGALLPALAARPNPQVWYTGSAVDQDVHQNGIVLARVRQRGLSGSDPALAYFEWSVAQALREIDEQVATDPAAWAQANPGLGIRITEDYIAREQRALDARTFAVERLGAGDWPDPTLNAGKVITREMWTATADPDSEVLDPVCFAVDVTPDRSAAAIGAAGRRRDRLAHIETVEHRRGTGWVADRLAELVAEHKTIAVVCDATGPAASLLPDLTARLAPLKLEVTLVNAKEHAQACGMLYDSVEQREVRHLGTPELTRAVDGAVKRPLGDSWAWSRKSSSVDISPLVAATLALWGALTIKYKRRRARVIDLAQALRDAERTEEDS